MPYRFHPAETVQDGLRRIAGEQVERMIEEIDDSGLEAHETIHQVRKRCKKVRGLLRLVRPALGDAYGAENARFRDAARTLSAVRDATALIEAYDALLAHYADAVDRRAFGPLRAALTRRRNRIAADEVDLPERLAAFRAEMVRARGDVEAWTLDAGGFDALGGGLRKTYKRGREARAQAQMTPTDPALHEWRKRVKYHWYHLRLLHAVWPRPMRALRHEASRLADLLGDDHDLAVFRRVLTDEPERFGRLQCLPAFVALLDRRRAELQARAWTLGHRLYAEKPGALVDRYGAWWAAAQVEQERDAALAV